MKKVHILWVSKYVLMKRITIDETHVGWVSTYVVVRIKNTYVSNRIANNSIVPISPIVPPVPSTAAATTRPLSPLLPG